MAVSLDEVDIQLLTALQTDADARTSTWPGRSALSPAATLHRVRQLKETGVIRVITARLDPAAAGFALTVYVAATLTRHDPRASNAFEDMLRSMPQVIAADLVAGEMDYLITLVTRDVAELQQVLSSWPSGRPAAADLPEASGGQAAVAAAARAARAAAGPAAGPPPAARVGGVPDRPPPPAPLRRLPRLLSQVLVAFTIEFDNQAEQRMVHRTTVGRADARRTGEAPRGPWLVSLPMWANFMRFVDRRRRAAARPGGPGRHRQPGRPAPLGLHHRTMTRARTRSCARPAAAATRSGLGPAGGRDRGPLARPVRRRAGRRAARRWTGCSAGSAGTCPGTCRWSGPHVRRGPAAQRPGAGRRPATPATCRCCCPACCWPSPSTTSRRPGCRSRSAPTTLRVLDDAGRGAA